MSIFFQLKRVTKKIFRRRKLIAGVLKLRSAKPLVILQIDTAGINIRTVQNLIFYLEPNYFIAITSSDLSFWVKFFTYLVPYRNVSIHPLVARRRSSAVKIITTQVSDNNKLLTLKLVDQPGDLSLVNVPYFKHPGFCWPVNKQPQQIQQNRSGWVFFGGNVDPALYNNPAFEAKYAMPDRYQVYQYLVTNSRLAKPGYFSAGDQSAEKQLFVHSLSANHLQPDQYMEYLQHFNCMVCAPGVTMPLCHNIIEAMEFGCIPIFSYPQWLPKGLQDGVNCFIYNSIAELADLLEKIANYEQATFATMRKNLADYYRVHFTHFNLQVENLDELYILNEHKQMLVVE